MKFEKRGELQMSEELDLSIDNYISNEFSICREERQYALYLSNVLRYYGKNPISSRIPGFFGCPVAVKHCSVK